jgi:hypothetical protein
MPEVLQWPSHSDTATIGAFVGSTSTAFVSPEDVPEGHSEVLRHQGHPAARGDHEDVAHHWRHHRRIVELRGGPPAENPMHRLLRGAEPLASTGTARTRSMSTLADETTWSPRDGAPSGPSLSSHARVGGRLGICNDRQEGINWKRSHCSAGPRPRGSRRRAWLQGRRDRWHAVCIGDGLVVRGACGGSCARTIVVADLLTLVGDVRVARDTIYFGSKKGIFSVPSKGGTPKAIGSGGEHAAMVRRSAAGRGPGVPRPLDLQAPRAAVHPGLC